MGHDVPQTSILKRAYKICTGNELLKGSFTAPFAQGDIIDHGLLAILFGFDPELQGTGLSKRVINIIER